MMSSIYRLMVSNELPDQDFFVPTQKFIDFMHETPWLRYRDIVEVGAGRGLVGSKIINNWTGIDVNTRATYASPVMTINALDYPFESLDVVLVCRPDHSGWHEALFDYACARMVQDFLYAGLEKNFDRDLGDEWVTEKLLDNAGKDGEMLWRVYGRTANCKTIVERHGGWWNLEGGMLVNSAGGRCPIDLSEVPSASKRKAADIFQMYKDPSDYEAAASRMDNYTQSKDEESGDKGNYGWLAPDAKFWACGSEDHAGMIYDCFGLDSSKISRDHWVKCYGKGWIVEYEFHKDAEFNQFSVPWKMVKELRNQGYTKRMKESIRDINSLSAAEQIELTKVLNKSA